VSYLLDSDWIFDYLGGRPEAGQLLTTLWTEGIAISIIGYLEVVEGIRGGQDPRRHGLSFRRFLKQVDLHGIGRPVADRAADIRIALRRQQRPIDHRALDILIAATAIEHKLTLVTRNIRDLADIPGLRLYDSP
jgi:tRNA(fMet)-specific endonuclease VapC